MFIVQVAVVLPNRGGTPQDLDYPKVSYSFCGLSPLEHVCQSVTNYW